MSLSQKVRAKIIADCYRGWNIQGKKVLDVGCGNGVVLGVLKEKLGIDIYGTDIINYCKFDIPFKQMSVVDKLPFGNLSFDYVMFNDVLHHAKNIEALILEGSRVAENILIFEDRNSFLTGFIDIALNYFYSSRMPPPLNYKTPQEWRSLFNKLGFSYETRKIMYPFWWPFRHMVFKLERKK